MTCSHHGANVPRENTDSGQSERGQTELRQPSTAREAKNTQWRAAQAPKAGHLQWPATGARDGYCSSMQNSKQSHFSRPKTGPSLTDKDWITRGLKPDSRLVARDVTSKTHVYNKQIHGNLFEQDPPPLELYTRGSTKLKGYSSKQLVSRIKQRQRSARSFSRSHATN